MSDLFASGHIIDAIFIVIAVEAILLLRRARWDLLYHLVAGVFLLLALRCSLVGTSWPWIGAALLGSFAAHLAALTARRSGK